MPDYQKMYAKLFNTITDVIEQLQQAQRETEAMYVESPALEMITLGSTTDGAVSNKIRSGN